MYCGKMEKKIKEPTKLVKENDAEIEENNKYRQGRSRNKWESNYMLQHIIFVTLLGLCFFVLAKLFFETVI